jgi:hypothetical protein
LARQKRALKMIVLAGMVVGILVGTFTAKNRGGQRLDLVQYGAVYGIAFTLIGVFVTIILERSL